MFSIKPDSENLCSDIQFALAIHNLTVEVFIACYIVAVILWAMVTHFCCGLQLTANSTATLDTFQCLVEITAKINLSLYFMEYSAMKTCCSSRCQFSFRPNSKALRNASICSARIHGNHAYIPRHRR